VLSQTIASASISLAGYLEINSARTQQGIVCPSVVESLSTARPNSLVAAGNQHLHTMTYAIRHGSQVQARQEPPAAST